MEFIQALKAAALGAKLIGINNRDIGILEHPLPGGAAPKPVWNRKPGGALPRFCRYGGRHASGRQQNRGSCRGRGRRNAGRLLPGDPRPEQDPGDAGRRDLSPQRNKHPEAKRRRTDRYPDRHRRTAGDQIAAPH